MAIETWRQQIGVRAAGDVINPRLERFADPGPAISSLGDSLMQAAEPIIRQDAEEQALRDAAASTLAKDENGNYVRPEGRRHGIIYARAFNQAVRRRHTLAIQRDAEQAFNELGNQVTRGELAYDDFVSQMEGRLSGYVEAAPADIRADVEEVLGREFLERSRGIGHAVASREYQANVNGLEQGVRTINEQAAGAYASALQQGLSVEQARAQAAPYYARMDEMLRELDQLDAVSPLGADAIRLGAANDRTRLEVGLQSRNTRDELLSSILQGRDGMDESSQLEQLTRLSYWALGARTDGEAFGMDFDQWQARYREMTDEDRGFLARFFGGEAGDIQTRLNAAAAEARAAEREERQTEALVGAIGRASADGDYNYGSEERQALETRFEQLVRQQFGEQPMAAALMTPEGTQMTIDFIGQFGMLPRSAESIIENYIGTSAGRDVHRLVVSIRNSITRLGANRGEILYRSLSPRVRGMVRFYDQQSRAGIPDNEIVSRLGQMGAGGAEPIERVRSLFVDENGRNTYGATRDRVLTHALGVSDPRQIPQRVIDDFEADLPWLTQIHGGDVGRASEEAAADIANGWAPMPWFVGGIGPVHMADPSLSPARLDPVLRRAFPNLRAPASLANGDGQWRFRLRAREYSPTSRFGRFDVVLIGPDGRVNNTSSQPVDLDTLLRGQGSMSPEQVRQARRQMVDAARTRAQRQAARDAEIRAAASRRPPARSNRGRDY